jgi:signal transduction histidine kinase
VTTLDIIIQPPWWQTTMAYVFYGVIFLLTVIVVDRVQRRRLKEKERAQTRERELKQAKEIEKAYNELKTTQQQLVHAEKMASLGELTAGIAHEIQNPLNFVNNFSEVSADLLEELKEELQKGDIKEVNNIASDLLQNLEKITHHGKRADGIVKGMLQHSRSGTEQKEAADINAIADEYLRLAYHGLRAKDKSFNADFKLEADETIPKVNVIVQEIGRVLLNLINNAFFSVSEKTKQSIDGYRPEVVVLTKKLKNQVEIRVKDNGTGIPDEIKGKIFQPFFTTKRTGEGTGLGLSLSYDIITKGHGGKLVVESIKGEGTEFIISLPITSD